MGWRKVNEAEISENYQLSEDKGERVSSLGNWVSEE